MCGQLLLGVLHRVVHMIYRRLQDFRSLRLYLILLQVFLYPCDNIAHRVGMMHTDIFNGEIRILSLLLVVFPEKLFEPHPRLLNFWNAILLPNRQPKLFCPADYHVGDVNCLQLGVGRPGGVSKLEELLDCGEQGHDRVARVVISLPDNVLPFHNLVWHQLTVVFLKERKYARHGVVNQVRGPVAVIR